MLSAWANFVVFKTDTLHNEGTPFKGVGDKQIVIDSSFDPQRHVRTYGEVVSVPKHLDRFPISQKHKGLPAYHDSPAFSFKYLSDIAQEIKVGDRIYFHFNTIRPDNLIKTEVEDSKKVYYFKVKYDQILCTVRDGVIIPIGSYTLIEPDMETWEDISVPTYSNIKGKDGKPMLKPKEQWLVKKVAPGAKYLLGFVRHVGTPLKGTECDVQAGDRIIYRRMADWRNIVEGKEYYAILHRHIVGKFVDGQPVPVGTNMFLIPEEIPTITDGGIHKVKLDIVKRGTVMHPGKSGLQALDFVEVGEADRQPIDVNGQKFISVDISSVWGVHVAKTA